MSETIDYFDGPTDFSLVQGGPLFQLLQRAGLMRSPAELLARRVVVIALLAWLPLLVLTLLSGHAYGGTSVPFLFDVDAQVRCLLVIPLLLAAEVVVHMRIKVVVRQFLDRAIVAPEDQSRFEQIIASAMRLRNSVFAEVLLIGLTYAGGYLVWKRHFALKVPTWIADPANGNMRFTLAGNWYFFVSLPIVRFLTCRWLFRLFVWYRFLWQVARRVPLRLNALHPDRAGGLDFLGGSLFAFGPFLLAQTIQIAGAIGGKIWHEGATLPQFKMEIAAWMLFLMLLVLAPLFFFTLLLADARRTGLREYGLVASRYVTEFRKKWIEGQRAEGESLVGSGDIQSLADLSNSFEVVRNMRLVPFGKATVVGIAILMALPFLPLVLTIIPLEKLIDRAMGVFF